MLRKTGDLKYLVKKENVDNITGANNLKFTRVFNKINREFMDTFIVNEEFLEKAEQIKRAMIMKAEGYANKDPYKMTIGSVELRDLLDEGKEAKNIDDWKLKSRVEKYMGFRVNEFQTTVRDFYGYVNLMIEHG